MITEKRFAASHHGFWRELLPMGEHYIRSVNRELARFMDPMDASSTTRFHGIVNELAFRLFVRGISANTPPSGLDHYVISAEVDATLTFIKRFRQHGRGPLPSPGNAEIRDAATLAQRIVDFFERSKPGELITQPRFPGCGWLSECEGDVLSSTVLYEIKAGERTFRMQDVKQVLVYCALNFSSKCYDIVDVCLVNPREGTYFSEPLGILCELVSGRSATDVLSEIVEYISQPDLGHGPGYGTG